MRLDAQGAVQHHVDELTIDPRILVDWNDNALDLGFRGALAWKSTLTVKGKAAGQVFRSPTSVPVLFG